MRILVIDDDEMVRQSLGQVLRDKGHDVATAPDGYRAMPVVAGDCPDVVITDILMPDQEGIETIRLIRKGHPQVKIIAISGGSRLIDVDVLQIARKLGADEIMTKPFDPGQLLRRLDELCGPARPAMQ